MLPQRNGSEGNIRWVVFVILVLIGPVITPLLQRNGRLVNAFSGPLGPNCSAKDTSLLDHLSLSTPGNELSRREITNSLRTRRNAKLGRVVNWVQDGTSPGCLAVPKNTGDRESTILTAYFGFEASWVICHLGQYIGRIE